MHCSISCPEMINCRCLLYISCLKDNRRIRDDIEQYSTQNSLWQLPPTCYFRWWSINSRQAGQDVYIMGITGSLYCLPSHLRHPTKAARSPSSVVCACMPPVCLSVSVHFVRVIRYARRWETRSAQDWWSNWDVIQQVTVPNGGAQAHSTRVGLVWYESI